MSMARWGLFWRMVPATTICGFGPAPEGVGVGDPAPGDRGGRRRRGEVVRGETGGKPSPVPRDLAAIEVVTIYLRRRLPGASSDLPEG